MVAQPTEQVIFPAQIEGLLRGLQSDVTPQLKAALRARGLNTDAPFPPAWPAIKLGDWLDVMAREVYADCSREEAHRRIGRRFMDGWQRTMLGAASAQLLRVLGMKRGLERLTRAFRTGDNFSEVSVVFPSERVGVVTIRSQRMPHYIAGILDGGLALLKVKGRVTIEQDTDAQMQFRVEWES